MRFMNSGVNLRRAASNAAREIFWASLDVHNSIGVLPLRLTGGEAQAGAQDGVHLGRSQVAGQEDQRLREVHAVVVAGGQRGLVQNAEQQVPERVAGLLNLVEQHEAQLHLVGVILVERFLAEHGVGFAVSQVSGRGTDQLGDLVAVLELGAIDLNDRARVATRLSATASTRRVLPEPVGPRKRRVPTGRPALDSPAR